MGPAVPGLPALLAPLQPWGPQPASGSPVDGGLQDGHEILSICSLVQGVGGPPASQIYGPPTRGEALGANALLWDRPKQRVQTVQPPTSFKMPPSCLELSCAPDELLVSGTSASAGRAKILRSSTSLMSFKMKGELW